MAEILDHALNEIRCETNQVMVVDSAVLADEAPAPYDPAWPSSTAVGQIDVGPNGILIDTVGPRYETVHFRLELWSGEPPPPHPAWDESWSGEIYFKTGKIHLEDYFLVDHGPERMVLDLRQSDSTWRVQLQRKLVKNDYEPDFPADMYQVDIYRIQFWRPDCAES
ncbi:hypothetical protein [Nonomuraea soli]|uniref:Uncharacterized protein n=1 Tax=Nonomuraea soli TaxID=1032476 RepID=A0A7W0HWA4_9ACTN|nr:hypothetical protein [Nonomuraea soli]MBA2897626.1 hypothetical protein [Nonomuraea soli]